MTATGPDSRPSWFESQPDRLKWELEQFAALGLPAAERVGRGDGQHPDSLVIETALPFQGSSVMVEVVFPYEYPDEGPQPYTAAGLLDRHQHPHTGLLCWAEDPDRDWWPGGSAAMLVDQVIRRLFEDTEAGPGAVAAGEADLPEPVSAYVALPDNGVVVVPDPFLELELPTTAGKMTVAGDGEHLMLTNAEGLGEADPTLVRRFLHRVQNEPEGFWVNLDPTPTPSVFNSRELFDFIQSAAPDAFGHLARRLQKKPRQTVARCWLGMTFLEEGPVRGEQRRNWVFAPISLDAQGQMTIALKRPAQALTLTERNRRTPELIGLGTVRALIIGAGSLGSPVAVELAKAGVGELDLVDSDIFDVNNSVRHALGPGASGRHKATVLAAQLESINPFINATAHVFSVGSNAEAARQLEQLIDASSVVVDTSGSAAVARILQRYAVRASKPVVVGGLSAGSYGGDLFISASGGACLNCFLTAQREGSIPEPQAAPPSALVTPVGCSHPAFAGAGFDATQLAATIARAVVQTAVASTYPPAGFNWAVLNFRSAPRWRSGTLEVRDDCSGHQ